MKILNCIFTLSLLLFPLIPLKSEAIPSQCQAVADDVSDEIKSYGVKTVLQRVNSYPKLHKGSLRYVIGSVYTDFDHVDDVMLSQQLHIKWAKAIFENCHGTKLFSIAVNNSDYIMDYVSYAHGESIHLAFSSDKLSGPDLGRDYLCNYGCTIFYKQVH